MASSPTSIAVTGRVFAVDGGMNIYRVTPVYNNPLQLNIVYDQISYGIRVTINGSSVDYPGSGLRAIVTNSSSLPSTILLKQLASPDLVGGALGTITIQDISPTLDFIAVTAGFNPNVARVLRLPPVTAHKRPIFIKLGRNAGTSTNDGVNIITRGDSFIDSVSRDTEVVGGTTYNHSGAVFIGGQSANGTAVNYPCITLFSDGSNWYVANYYPMNTSASFNQYLLAGLSDANPDPAKLATANASGVNIFKNGVALRQTGNNMVLLPTPTSPSICMIVYGGNQGTRASGNALIIKDTRGGSWIDGFSANNPCILIDGDNGTNAKSSGIVLFYDTTGSGKWYVIGWYYPYQWTWGNSSTAGTYGDIQGYHAMKDLATPAGQERKICVAPDIVGARFYILPTSTATNPQVIIFKAKNINVVPGATDGREDVRGLRYSTQNSSTINNNRINTNTISIKYGSTDSNHATSKYSCVWFVSEQVTGESFLRYYPVIAYVPNP